MAEILHRFVIHAPVGRVCEALVTPAGLDSWWTVTPAEHDGVYEFGFGPEYQWRAVVVRRELDSMIEWELTDAMEDWMGTRLGFVLRPSGDGTEVEFHHAGWAEASPHFRTTSYCWAMYLRLLKRFVEAGEVVPYVDRLEV